MNKHMEEYIYALCKEKGWVDPATCLRVAKEIGEKKVIAILEAQPKAIRAGYNRIGG